MKEKFKFGIIGVGPTGGILAVYLAKEGYNVVLVDINKSHMDTIKKKGLSITNLKEIKVKFPKENICYSVDELQNKDIDTLFIAVKASHLNTILPQIKKIVPPNTTLISLQNGFDTEEFIAEYAGVENTIRVVVNYAGNLIKDGVIRMSFFNPPNYIGVLSAKAEEKAKKLAEIINSSGLDTLFTEEIKKFEWRKCILNCISPVCVTTRTTMKQTMSFRDTREICREILREGIEVARARGITYEPDFLDHAMEYLDKAGHHRVSMEADINAGIPSEIDFLNGKIVEYGKTEGIPTLYNKIFVSLIKGCELPPINHEK
ncbi:MAG: ketopantoate reductase family protein [Candidatus Thorarchaeota archaeon]